MKARTLFFVIALVAAQWSDGLAQEWDEPTSPDQRLASEDGNWFGYSVARRGDHLFVGSYFDSLVSPGGAVYVYEWDAEKSTWVETQELESSDLESGDRFGCAVAAWGDTLLVGAQLEDESGSNAGAAYVFEFDSDTGEWREIQKLAPKGLAAGHRFGFSLWLDGQWAIISSHQEDELTGAVYFFRKDDDSGDWIEEQRYQPADAEEGDNFGFRVRLLGDVAVATANHTFKDTSEMIGYADVLRWSVDDDAWLVEQSLEASDGALGDEFGVGLSLAENQIVIGARASDAAYVFEWNGLDEEWSETAKLEASDGSGGDQFGSAVSTDGRRVLVASMGSGAAYLFHADPASSDWIEVAKLVPPKEVDADEIEFGWDCLLSREALFVAARVDTSVGEGAVYVFDRPVQFERGDVNSDGDVDALSDGLSLLRWAFVGGEPPSCMDAADVNDDGSVEGLPDGLAILAWGFTDGPAPPAPGPSDCGADPTEDDLGCERVTNECL